MEKGYQIILTEKELIKFYANKIIEDGLDETSEFNYSIYFDQYEHYDFIKQHQEEILKYIKRDERVTDVYIDNESFDMVFSLDYCPYYYEEELAEDLNRKEEVKMFNRFIKYIKEAIKHTRKEDFYTSTRQLLNNFILKIEKEKRDNFINRANQLICDSGFNEKYIDRYEVLIDSTNINEFKAIFQENIKSLVEQTEEEESR